MSFIEGVNVSTKFIILQEWYCNEKHIFWIYFHENNSYLNAILLENHKILHGVEKYKYGNGSLISLEVQ